MNQVYRPELVPRGTAYMVAGRQVFHDAADAFDMALRPLAWEPFHRPDRDESRRGPTPRPEPPLDDERG